MHWKFAGNHGNHLKYETLLDYNDVWFYPLTFKQIDMAMHGWNPSSTISLDWEQTTPLSAKAAKRICCLHFSAIISYWSLLIVKRTRSNKHLFEYCAKIILLKVYEENVIAISLLIEILTI